MKNLKIGIIILAFLSYGCAGRPTLRSFNYISLKMDKDLVLEQLGDPDTQKGVDGKDIMVYYIEDGGRSYASRTFWVILEEDQVVFFGRAREYHAWIVKGAMKKKGE
jgi:hypothetical protein